jgi:hypothetical protein
LHPQRTTKVITTNKSLASPWSDWVTGASIHVDARLHLIGEESYVWAIERAMGHHDQIPPVPMCWPPGALEKGDEEETG